MIAISSSSEIVAQADRSARAGLQGALALSLARMRGSTALRSRPGCSNHRSGQIQVEAIDVAGSPISQHQRRAVRRNAAPHAEKAGQREIRGGDNLFN